MRHRGAPLRQQPQLLLQEVHAVRQDGLLSEEPGFIVHVGVVVALLVQPPHGLHLAYVLRDVRLDVQVLAAGDVGQPLHEVHVAAYGEAWRDDGLHQRILHALHPVHEGVRVVDGLLRALVVVLRVVDVHVDLADERALSRARHAPRQLQRALGVDGGEVAGQRGAGTETAAHDRVVHLGGELLVGVPSLQRERVRVEPVQQGLVVAQARVGELRRVHVRVDEARQQQLSGTQHDGRAQHAVRGAQRDGIAAAEGLGQHHLAVPHDEDAVVHHGDLLEALRMDERPQEHGGRFHLARLVRERCDARGPRSSPVSWTRARLYTAADTTRHCSRCALRGSGQSLATNGGPGHAASC